MSKSSQQPRSRRSGKAQATSEQDFYKLVGEVEAWIKKYVPDGAACPTSLRGGLSRLVLKLFEALSYAPPTRTVFDSYRMLLDAIGARPGNAAPTGRQDETSLFLAPFLLRVLQAEGKIVLDEREDEEVAAACGDVGPIRSLLFDYDPARPDGPPYDAEKTLFIRRVLELFKTGRSGKGKRGRPKDYDPKEDKRIYEAWKSGSFKKYEELGREKDMKAKDIGKAIDRHRQRLRRTQQS